MNKFKENQNFEGGTNTPKFLISPETSNISNEDGLKFIKFKKNFNLSFANSDNDSLDNTSKIQGVSTISNFQLLNPREQ